MPVVVLSVQQAGRMLYVKQTSPSFAPRYSNIKRGDFTLDADDVASQRDDLLAALKLLTSMAAIAVVAAGGKPVVPAHVLEQARDAIIKAEGKRA